VTGVQTCALPISKWNPRADVKEDGLINVLDLITIAGKLGT
jgi:hypothetical protein